MSIFRFYEKYHSADAFRETFNNFTMLSEIITVLQTYVNVYGSRLELIFK